MCLGQPEVTAGLRTPGISGGISPPTPTNALPHTHTATLSVTPTTLGVHHICVNVKQSTKMDSVCYTVSSQGSSHPTIPPPGAGHFTGITPSQGARIPCHDDRPCHVIVQTEKPMSGTCENVASRSNGTYTFQKPSDGQTCNTDVLLDPKHIHNNQACIKVGNNGEERCYTIDEIDHATDPCGGANNPGQCEHGGQCINRPQSSPFFHCVCPPLYDGDHCQHGHTDEPVNKNADTSKPHAVVPTPINGLQISCHTGDTCTIPIYVTGGGQVSPGQRTPDIQSSTGPLVATSHPPNTHVSPLTVTPTKDGTHHVCVNVHDNSGAVKDNVCYTIVSTTPSSTAATTTLSPGGGRFKEGTPPSGSDIKCRDGLSCHLIVHSNKPPSHPCFPVQTHDAGLSAFQTAVSSSDTTTCDTDILIDPAKVQGHGRVCIQAALTPNGSGEKRCYTVTSVPNTDKCSGSPCHNGGQCVLMPADHDGYNCVCPPFFTGPHCDTDRTDVPVNKDADIHKPHAVVPTPVNGLEIPCDIGSTCTIPIYVTGGGHVAPGRHTPDIQTATGPPVGTNQLPHTTVSPLKVNPTTAGPHHVCVDIQDNSGVVDNICYTVVGKTPNSTPAPAAGGGRFKDGTPPNGADIKCRTGVPCQLVVHTNKPPSHPCIPVQTPDDGLSTFAPVTSSSDSSTCETVVLIDPQKAHSSSAGHVCIQASRTPSNAGEKRCYTVTPIDDTGDKCGGHPCLNGGECVLTPSQSPGYSCVCPPVTTGQHCDSVSSPCQTKGCGPDANCVLYQGTAVCECPLGRSGDTCSLTNTNAAVNKGADTNKAHALVPTTPTGSRILCHTGSTCKVPLYVTSGGQVSPGLHTLGITTGRTPQPGTSSRLPNSQTSILTVTPNTDGEHRACFDVTDPNSGVVDHVCYTIESSTNSGQLPQTTIGPNGGRFTDSTLPDGSTVLCHSGVPCHLMAGTETPPSGHCVPVQAKSDGSFSFQTLSSTQASNTCETDILIDPKLVQGHGPVCFEAAVAPNSGGETRCYKITEITDPTDACASQPCYNGGQCVLDPTDSTRYKCVCPPVITGHACETLIVPSPCQTKGCGPDAKCVLHQGTAVCECPLGRSGDTCSVTNTNTAVNKGADTNKAHALVPTAPTGSRILCHTGSTCKVPLFVTSGGQVSPGLHTPGITTGRPPQPGTPSRPPNSQTSILTVTPNTDGEHRACFDVTDPNSGVVDHVCYTIESSTNTGQLPQTTIGPNGGRFTDSTLPDGSTVLCHSGVPCHLMAGTETPPSGHCVPVQAKSDGSFSFQTFSSSLASNTCETDILIDPKLVQGHGPVCFEAAMAPNSGGETRCYKITEITDPTDACASQPCHNGGQCVLDPTDNTGYKCVCPPVITGHTCETLIAGTTVSQAANPNGGVPITQTAQQTTGALTTQTAQQTTGALTTQTAHQTTGALTTQTAHQTTDGSTTQQSAQQTMGGTVSQGNGAISTTSVSSVNQQCAARREAFRKAAKAGRVRCTCVNPNTNKTYTVIRPRVSNEQLLRAGGIGSGVSIGGMVTAALIYFLVQKVKKRMANAASSVGPPTGFPLQRRESGAWPDTGR